MYKCSLKKVLTYLGNFFVEEQHILCFLLVNAIFLCGVYFLHTRSLLLIYHKTVDWHDFALVSTYTMSLFGIICFISFFFYRITQKLLNLKVFQRFNSPKTLAILLLIWIQFLYIFTILEIKIYSIMNVHLYGAFILKNLFNFRAFHQDLNLKAGNFLGILLVFSLILVLNIALLKYLFRLKDVTGKRRNIPIGLSLVLVVWVGASTIYASINIDSKERYQLEILPFYDLDFSQYLRFFSPKFNYPKGEATPPKLKNKKNVLFILVETLRSTIVTPETAPNITNFTASHPCILSRNHFAGAHWTEYSTFSYLSGLHSYHLDFFSDNQNPLFPFETLKHNGYSLYGVSASDLMNFDRQIQGILHQFDIYQETSRLPTIKKGGWQKDQKLLEWVENKYSNHNHDKPYFFFVFLYSTHYAYFSPPEFRKFTPIITHSEMWDFLNLTDRKGDITPIYNRYKNSMLYVDDLFSKLLKIFKKDLEEDNLVIVLTSDHGELFCEDGYSFGHVKTCFPNTLVKVPFLFYAPGIKQKAVSISSHVDIMPTLFDYLQPSPAIKTRNYFSGKSLFSPQQQNEYRCVFTGLFPYWKKECCLITKDGKYWLKKGNFTLNKTSSFSIYKKTDLEDNPITESPESLEKALEDLPGNLRHFFTHNTDKKAEK